MKKIILLISSMTSFLVLFGFAQEDPYKSKPSDIRTPETASRQNISLCYEVFSLTISEAAVLQRQNLSGPEFYQELVEGLTSKTTKQEVFSILRSRSGNKVSSAAIYEYIYPIEYEPAALPNSVGVALIEPKAENQPTPPADAIKLKNAALLGSLPVHVTPATATAFETRYVGDLFEYKSTLNKEESKVDLRIMPSHVNNAGRIHWGQGVSRLEFPKIETQRLVTRVTAHLGRPLMLGTINRPPNSEIDPDSPEKIFYAFVTVSLVKSK